MTDNNDENETEMVEIAVKVSECPLCGFRAVDMGDNSDCLSCNQGELSEPSGTKVYEVPKPEADALRAEYPDTVAE